MRSYRPKTIHLKDYEDPVNLINFVNLACFVQLALFGSVSYYDPASSRIFPPGPACSFAIPELLMQSGYDGQVYLMRSGGANFSVSRG